MTEAWAMDDVTGEISQQRFLSPLPVIAPAGRHQHRGTPALFAPMVTIVHAFQKCKFKLTAHFDSTQSTVAHDTKMFAGLRIK